MPLGPALAARVNEELTMRGRPLTHVEEQYLARQPNFGHIHRFLFVDSDRGRFLSEPLLSEVYATLTPPETFVQEEWENLVPFCHGTNPNAAALIARDGLRPRGFAPSAWADVPSMPDRAYLGVARKRQGLVGCVEAMGNARDWEGGELILFGSTALAAGRLVPDEDSCTYGSDRSPSAIDSASRCGIFGVRGTVPPSSIIGRFRFTGYNDPTSNASVEAVCRTIGDFSPYFDSPSCRRNLIETLSRQDMWN